MIESFHTPPKGFSYEFESYKRNIIRIWIHNHYQFSYTSKQVKSIWGFYNTSKKTFYAPIKSDKVGDVVEIEDTTPYSAMQIKKPLAPTVLQFF